MKMKVFRQHNNYNTMSFVLKFVNSILITAMHPYIYTLTKMLYMHACTCTYMYVHSHFYITATQEQDTCKYTHLLTFRLTHTLPDTPMSFRRSFSWQRGVPFQLYVANTYGGGGMGRVGTMSTIMCNNYGMMCSLSSAGWA